jgi:hypothetical protein
MLPMVVGSRFDGADRGTIIRLRVPRMTDINATEKNDQAQALAFAAEHET